MTPHPLFLLGLSLLLAHEVDAVRLREWRILPILSRLDDEAGYHWFTALHVPLLALLLWGAFGSLDAGPNAAVVAALDAFLVIHVGLHLMLLRHPENRFRSAFSWSLILGAGCCGALDLLLG